MQEIYSPSDPFIDKLDIQYAKGYLEASLPQLEKQLKELEEAQRVSRTTLEIRFTI